jgi:hypothetical protein
MAEWGNLRNWLSGSPRERELRETKQAWHSAETLWRATPLAFHESYQITNEFMIEAAETAERCPATSVMTAFANAIDDLFRAEDIIAIEPDWPLIERDIEVAIEAREVIARRRRWCSDYGRMHGIFRRQVLQAYRAVFDALPESCFERCGPGAESFEVPLIELLNDPASFIDQLIAFAYDSDTLRLDIFLKYRQVLFQNLLVASGYKLGDDPSGVPNWMTKPHQQRGKTPRELAELYLRGTPFLAFLELPVPFSIPEEARFEHCHIVGGLGRARRSSCSE